MITGEKKGTNAKEEKQKVKVANKRCRKCLGKKIHDGKLECEGRNQG